jgi:hypothetical protein
VPFCISAKVGILHGGLTARNSVVGALLLRCPSCCLHPCFCWFSDIAVVPAAVGVANADLTSVTNLSPIVNLPAGVVPAKSVFCCGLSYCNCVLAIAASLQLLRPCCCCVLAVAASLLLLRPCYCCVLAVAAFLLLLRPCCCCVLAVAASLLLLASL